MSVLAFDTATRATAVALVDPAGEALLARDDPDPGQRPAHTTRLMALIAERWPRRGGWSAVERIAVGTGPGTFTGPADRCGHRAGAGRAREPAGGRLDARFAGPRADATPARAPMSCRRAGRPPPGGVRRRLGHGLADRRRAVPLRGQPATASAAARRRDPPDALAGAAASLRRCLAVGEGALGFSDVLEAGGIRSPRQRVRPAPGRRGRPLPARARPAWPWRRRPSAPSTCAPRRRAPRRAVPAS